uniref:Putative secreted protein n=1 Tax=Anopheles marajoara TaxID=58244 RepID=A0A2M4CCQ7_9DIPT
MRFYCWMPSLLSFSECCYLHTHAHTVTRTPHTFTSQCRNLCRNFPVPDRRKQIQIRELPQLPQLLLTMVPSSMDRQ